MSSPLATGAREVIMGWYLLWQKINKSLHHPHSGFTNVINLSINAKNRVIKLLVIFSPLLFHHTVII